MPKDVAYREAEMKIENAQRLGETALNLSHLKLVELPDSLGEFTQLKALDLANNYLTELPESFGQLKQLESLDLMGNQLSEFPFILRQLKKIRRIDTEKNKLTEIPYWIYELQLLEILRLYGNQLTNLPDSFGELSNLKTIYLGTGKEGNPFEQIPACVRRLSKLNHIFLEECELDTLPDWLSELKELKILACSNNRLTDIPSSLCKLVHLEELHLANNPLNPELSAAYKQGFDAVMAYLRAKAAAQITLNEAKLILVGEGEVGKTCLMDSLLGKPFQEHNTTHGIEIKSIKLTDPESVQEIVLNGWDFGGQRVYRPTHQLFFSAPAVYLVVWKPREGSQQGFVKERIQLIKYREPDAKILVVATHGGPGGRQPDIDRQELWDLFGNETVVDFYHVESKPNENGYRRGIRKLKHAIARVAATLPDVGRSVPQRWQEARNALKETNAAYLSLDQALAICKQHQMEDTEAKLFVTLEHRLGHLIHYEHDPTLRDIVVLKPDWLATAISFVLDDEETRLAHGLVPFSRLGQLWSDPERKPEERYPADLHSIFVRLMERFDLSYRVVGIHPDEQENETSLIAQLVPDTTPQVALEKVWLPEVSQGDFQQMQICKVVDEKGISAAAEGLFYQLIVRLHKYSLGRDDYHKSVHWQRGLVLDDEYNGRALLRHVGNNVQITVRAPYPERFLAMLTEEVRFLIESFWEGLRCDVMVPCLNETFCIGLFEVRKLMENKRRGRPEQPCPVCNEWQDIEQLLHNAPVATQPISLDILMKEFAEVKDTLNEVNDNTRRILSQVDKKYDDLIQVFTDEAKEGPRLFSLFPLDDDRFNLKNWIRHQFRLVLWCEHSRLPLPVLNNGDMKKGVYDLELNREWFVKSAPYLKLVTSTLSLVLPVASSTLKVVNDVAFKSFQDQFGLGKDVIDAISGEANAIKEYMTEVDTTYPEKGVAIRADSGTLRELHAILKKRDPSFGGLVRVMNKRQEFLWVHERFAGEY